MNRSDILYWLCENRPEKLPKLWQWANRVRRENAGGEIHLRGLIEISNHCVRQCAYCGLRHDNRNLERYRMNKMEIMESVRKAVHLGFGTIVLQAGEDPGITSEWMADLIRRIKSETSLAVALNLGERNERELAIWRQAGADRYLLRFESSNQKLYQKYHPARPFQTGDRFDLLRVLKKLRYEVGSGIMIGLPGQTFDSLIRDIQLLKELELDMVAVGPYIINPETPLGKSWAEHLARPEFQVPNSDEMAYKTMAVTRIICPLSNIPVTTATASVGGRDGLEVGLGRGANVFMPNLTPANYRCKYRIYPSKSRFSVDDFDSLSHLRFRIKKLGRRLGEGRGDSKRYVAEIKRSIFQELIS
ncbi:MAG: [FeFe] hydrogenase H-cluster radical SAM maturase HydE [Deltaproteobacteria bacterium]|nr:[FeFe] hydrogenase H-cluster radical SAM maturase HydE [Deltaproteobacteria bacterium]